MCLFYKKISSVSKIRSVYEETQETHIVARGSSLKAISTVQQIIYVIIMYFYFLHRPSHLRVVLYLLGSLRPIRVNYPKFSFSFNKTHKQL